MSVLCKSVKGDSSSWGLFLLKHNEGRDTLQTLLLLRTTEASGEALSHRSMYSKMKENDWLPVSLGGWYVRWDYWDMRGQLKKARKGDRKRL